VIGYQDHSINSEWCLRQPLKKNTRSSCRESDSGSASFDQCKTGEQPTLLSSSPVDQAFLAHTRGGTSNEESRALLGGVEGHSVNAGDVQDGGGSPVATATLSLAVVAVMLLVVQTGFGAYVQTLLSVASLSLLQEWYT
jgi:hypothetical protein